MSAETDTSSVCSHSSWPSSPSPLHNSDHPDPAALSPDSTFAARFDRSNSFESDASSFHSAEASAEAGPSGTGWGKRLLKKVSLPSLRQPLRPDLNSRTESEPPLPKLSDSASSASSGFVPTLRSSASQIFSRSRKNSRPPKPKELPPSRPTSPPPMISLAGHSKHSSMSSSPIDFLTHEEMAAWVIQPRALPLPLPPLPTAPSRSPALRHTPSLGSISPGAHSSPRLADVQHRRAKSLRRLPSRNPSETSPSMLSSAEFSSFDMERSSTGSTSIMSASEAVLSTEPPSAAPFAQVTKIKVDPAKRDAALAEMVATEKTYVKNLAELCEIYIAPASQSVAFSSGKKDTVLPASERRAVFGNIEAIHHFHSEVLLPDLEAALTATGFMPDGTPREPAHELAQVFIRHTAFLKIYSSYVNSFDSALSRIQSWRVEPPSPYRSPRSTNTSPNTSPNPNVFSFDGPIPTSPVKSQLSTSQRKRIKAYLKRSRADPRHSQISLESYLLLPVQRIPRYKMLLESLRAVTGVPAFTSFDPAVNAANAGSLAPDPTVQLALDLVCEMATSMNERKRESEGRQQLLYWQGRIGAKFKSPLVQPHRVLIRAGPMKLVRVAKLAPPTAEAPSTPGEVVSFEAKELNLIALLCTDLLVFVKEPADPSDNAGPLSLFTVMRLSQAGSNGEEPPVSLAGAENVLRVTCDHRAILFIQCADRNEARSWRDQINLQQSLHLLPTPAPTPSTLVG